MEHTDFMAAKGGSRFWTGARPLVLMASTFFVGMAIWNLSHWPAAWRYPGEISDIEGRPMTEMVQLRRGVPIYAPASPAWYDSANYGPLYYLIGSRLVDPQHPGYRNLRWLSMLATLGCALVCGMLAWSFSRRWPAAVTGAVLFLAFPLVHSLALTDRCDMLALFPAAGGFLLAYHFRWGRRALWACPLFVLGLYCKQVFVAAPAAVLTFLLIKKRFRTAAEFAAACSAGFLVVLLILEKAVFPGEPVLLHMFTYNVLPFSFHRLGFFLAVLAMTLLPAMVGALESLRSSRDGLLALYFGWTLTVAVAAIAKEGSSILYFAEFVLVACPLLAKLLDTRVSRGDVPSAVQLFVLIAASLILTSWLHPAVRPSDVANDAAIQAYLRRFPRGTVALSEYAGDLTRAGLATPIADLYQYSWLRCEGKIPPAQLDSDVGSRRFALILVRTDLTDPVMTRKSQDLCWTEDLRHTILENYRPDETFRAPLPDRHLAYHAWVPR